MESNEFFDIFGNTTNYLKACFIVEKLNKKPKPDYELIQHSFKELISIDLELQKIKNFAQKITNYPIIYPFEFMTNIDNFKQNLIRFAINNEKPSIILTSPALQCNNCSLDTPNWFLFCKNQSNNIPMLYSDMSIG